MTFHIFRPCRPAAVSASLRRTLCVIGFALALAAPAHSAITVTAEATDSSGNPLLYALPGELITIDITIRNDGERVLALGISANGYDSDILSLQSGSLSPSFLTSVCLPTLGCLGGIDNLAAVQGGPTEIANPLGPTVQVALGVSLAGVTNTGSVDEGVITGLPGDPQFQLVYLVTGAGSTTIHIGADPDYGDAVIGIGGFEGTVNGATVTFNLIPEPGTALLLGLGLIGLARRAG